jgi:lysophospholipase L1-like esterase
MLRLISCLLLAVTASAPADPVVIWPLPVFPPDLPVACFPMPRLDWLGNFQDNLTASRSKPVDLVFDGDCATLLWQRAAPQVWQERYTPLNAFNFAQIWDRPQNILWRVDNGELDGLHPKLIVLMVSNHDNNGTSAADVAAGITALVAAYRQHAPDSHVLLLGTLPVAASPTDPARVKATEINQAIAKLDDGKYVTFLDFGPKFLQPDGTLLNDVMVNDDAGLTGKGYQIWADAIQPVVDQYCPKASATASTAFTPVPLPQHEPVTYPLPTVPAGTPAAAFPLPDADWYDRFQGNLDKLKDGPYDLIFDGDSITDNWQGPGAGVWKERYGALKAADFAIGGDQVQHLLWRVQHGELAGQSPKLIVLLIGTNNGGQDPKSIAAGIRLLLNEYETRCPRAHILLQGVFTRDHDANTPTRNWVKAINAILSTYSSDPRVTFMDFGDKFLQPDGTLSADIMPDFLHPSAKGYVIWADQIQPVIERYCGTNSGK